MRELLNTGDVVVYGTQGVCRIDCIQSKQIGRQSAEYYVLKPVFNESTAVFVPVDNETLVAKMQKVLNKAQIKELIAKTPDIDIIKVSDENQKREIYKSILSGNDREQLISLIKTIRLERDTRRQNNKKLNINDEQTLRKAEMLLYNEVAFVNNIEPDEARNLINF